MSPNHTDLLGILYLAANTPVVLFSCLNSWPPFQRHFDSVFLQNPRLASWNGNFCSSLEVLYFAAFCVWFEVTDFCNAKCKWQVVHGLECQLQMKSWHLPFLFLQSQSSQCNFEKSDIWVPRPRRIMIIPSGERSCSAYRRAVGASGGSVLGTLCHNCPQLANLFCSNISETEATFHVVGMGESNFVLTKADKDGPTVWRMRR